MAILQYDLSQFNYLDAITGIRDLISNMAEKGTLKVDLLNVDIDDLQNILSWADFYFKISELKHLKDTV